MSCFQVLLISITRFLHAASLPPVSKTPFVKHTTNVVPTLHGFCGSYLPYSLAICNHCADKAEFLQVVLRERELRIREQELRTAAEAQHSVLATCYAAMQHSLLESRDQLAQLKAKHAGPRQQTDSQTKGITAQPLFQRRRTCGNSQDGDDREQQSSEQHSLPWQGSCRQPREGPDRGTQVKQPLVKGAPANMQDSADGNKSTGRSCSLLHAQHACDSAKEECSDSRLTSI